MQQLGLQNMSLAEPIWFHASIQKAPLSQQIDMWTKVITTTSQIQQNHANAQPQFGMDHSQVQQQEKKDPYDSFFTKEQQV